MQLPPSYHPDLIELVELFLEPMQAFLPQERAEALALALVEAIRSRFGGLLVYIPAGYHLNIQRRNAAIRKAFNGKNHKELARHYGLAQRTVYRILKQDREKKGEDQG